MKKKKKKDEKNEDLVTWIRNNTNEKKMDVLTNYANEILEKYVPKFLFSN